MTCQNTGIEIELENPGRSTTAKSLLDSAFPLVSRSRAELAVRKDGAQRRTKRINSEEESQRKKAILLRKSAQRGGVLHKRIPDEEKIANRKGLEKTKEKTEQVTT